MTISIVIMMHFDTLWTYISSTEARVAAIRRLSHLVKIPPF